MDGENGRRLTTNANVADNRGETFRAPFSLVNSETSSSNRTEQEGISVSSHNGKNHVPVEASFRFENSVIDSPDSIKHSSGVSFRPTDSPNIQVMERTLSPDPKDSSAKTDSPSRWSDGSNDSLFSIGMENDSFSREVSLRMSGEMCTAGELSLSEAYLPRVSPRNGELYQSAELHKSPGAEEIGEAKAANEVVDETNPSGSIDPDASNHHSGDSNVGKEAFASALTTGYACPLCKCLCCGKMKCCCGWPSCKWFGWPSCCSNNCLRWPSCCSCCSKCSFSNLICTSCCSWKRETKRARSSSDYS